MSVRVFVFALICLLTPFATLAASFDCTKGTTRTEHFICDQEQLSFADDHVGALYAELLPTHPELKTSQFQWFRERNDCDSLGCLKKVYERRVYALARLKTIDAGIPSASLPDETVFDGPWNSPERKVADEILNTEYERELPGKGDSSTPPPPATPSAIEDSGNRAPVEHEVKPASPPAAQTATAPAADNKPAPSAGPGIFSIIFTWIIRILKWIVLLAIFAGGLFLLYKFAPPFFRWTQARITNKKSVFQTRPRTIWFLVILVGGGLLWWLIRDNVLRDTSNQLWWIFNQRAGSAAVAFAIGLIAGTFFSDLLRPFRALIWVLAFVAAVIWAMLTSDSLAQIVAFLAGFIIAWNLFRDVVKKLAAARAKPTTFGTAEWADYDHLIKHELLGEKGLYLGHFPAEGGPLPMQYTGDRHLLTVAPTRAGKGVSAILPNLLNYSGSALIIDPKGENTRITLPRRGSGDSARGIPGMNQNVYVVDPWEITGYPPARFNPLDWLDPNDPDIIENTMMLADSIVVKRGGDNDAFWDEEAKALLMGFILYVATDPAEAETRNLGRVRDIIVSGEDELAGILANMYASDNPIVGSTAARTDSKEAKLKMSVLAALQSHTHFLDSPRIRESLSHSDFRFEDLKTGKMTVYLVLPADRLETFGRWLRLLVQQAITVNARNIEAKPEQPILFMLDEMAALEKLKMVEQAYGLMAGFGMQLWGIVQDLSQLERIYDKGWQTFIGNSGVLQYYGSRDHKTADYFSKLCGVTTIEKFSFTKAIARAFSSSSTSGVSSSGSSSSTTTGDSTSYTDSTTVDVVQRHLAYPDELMVMRKNEALVLVESFNPIRGIKVRWFDHSVWKTLGVNLHSP